MPALTPGFPVGAFFNGSQGAVKPVTVGVMTHGLCLTKHKLLSLGWSLRSWHGQGGFLSEALLSAVYNVIPLHPHMGVYMSVFMSWPPFL